jgi:hypothetical protein
MALTRPTTLTRKSQRFDLHTYRLRGTILPHAFGGLLECLYYDNAWPATTADANIIERSVLGENIEPVEFAVNALHCTAERWKTYGFEVL